MASFLLRLLAGALAALCFFAPALDAIEAVWVGGPGGNWSDPANWSTAVVPNDAATNVTIDDNSLLGAVSLLDQDAAVGNLVVEHGDVLILNAARVLTTTSATIGGGANLTASSRLHLSDHLWVRPEGVLTLDDASASVSGSSAPFYLLRNEGLITGTGVITRPALVNEGKMVANVPGKQLRIDPYSATYFNRGEMIAENGGSLSFTPSSLASVENSNGLIEARGDSAVFLPRIRLSGGRVSTSPLGGDNEGVVTLSFSVIDDVTLHGNVKLDSVMLSGRVTNNTRLEETAANNLYVEGFVTISGGGWLELNNGVISTSTASFPTTLGTLPGLINDVDHTVKGPGVINPPSATDRIALENRGIVETDEGNLQINLRSTTQPQSLAIPSINSGTIRAMSGGRVEILGSNSTFGDTLTNSAGATMGVVEAGADSTIALGNITLRGGVLRAVTPEEGSTARPGKVVTSGTLLTVLEDLRLEGRIGETLDNSRFGLAGTIENGGVMASGFAITKPTTLTGGGEVHLQNLGGITGYAPQLDGFYDPLINQDNLIRGAGGIGGNLVFINRGVVQADILNTPLWILRPDSPSSVDPQPFANSGEFRAINGAKLTIGAQIVNFEGSNLGTIHAGDGSEVHVAEVSGGILTTEGSGKIIFGAAGNAARALDNVHNAGSLVIGIWGTSLFRGRTVNDGTVTQMAATQVSFGGPFAELMGNGVWGTASTSLAFVVGTPSAASIFTHGPDHTIQGGGTITVTNGAFVNRGTVIANGTTPLRIAVAQGATIQQHGTLTIPNTRAMEVQTNDELFINRGIVDAAGTFQLKRMNAGKIEFRNAPGAELHINAIFSVMLPNSSGFAISMWNQNGALMTGNGKVNLYRSLANHETLLRNSGTLRPEGDSGRFGEIFISSNFQQDTTGLLELEIGGSPTSGIFDSLHVTEGRTSLAGSLDISLANGYDPAIGDRFEILTNQGGLISGMFDKFTAPALAGRWWALSFLPDKVVLSVEQITADFDGNGIVDYLDLDDWKSTYGVDSSADADGDGDTDGRDFLAWQRQVGSGLPTGGLLAAVPEPSGLLIALGVLVLAASRRGVKYGSPKLHRRPTMLAVLVALCTSSVCHEVSAVEAVWIGGPAGTWSDAMNWSTGSVPNLATANVTIDNNSQESVVVLDQNATIQNLVLNTGDLLKLGLGRVLTTNAAIVGGEVALGANSQLKASDYLWIETEGTISLSDTAQLIRSGTAQYVPILNQGRIEGAGGFLANDYRFTLNNEGAVVANVPGKQLQLKLLGTNERGVHLNNGELVAETGGELRVSGEGSTLSQGFFTPLDNAHGVIEARGDSKISLSNLRLVGGQLTTSSTGGTNEGLITLGSVMFDNVILEGNLMLNSVTFSNRVVNNTDVVADTFFVEGYAMISGSGSMDLNGGWVSIPGQSYGGVFVGTPGFVNDVNHTIRGPGSINPSSSSPTNRLAFDNRGLIENEGDLGPSSNTLQINLRSFNSQSGGPSINSGKIRAKSGSRIEIFGTSINDELTNFSGGKQGLVEAGVGSTIAMGSMTLRGGVLRADGVAEGSAAKPGKVITRREDNATLTATLDSLRIEGTVGDNVANSRWNLAGTIENTGVLTGQIMIAKPTTLSGDGVVRVEESSSIRRLEPVSSNYKIPLVNENNLIHGEGEIGRDLAFTNRGIVQADVANKSLTVFQGFSSDSLSFSNSGVFRAINGAKLVVHVPLLNSERSALGTIHAGEGSEVQVFQVTGGVISTDESGKVVVVSTGSLTSGPLITDVHNQGALFFDSMAQLRGRIINDGKITQNDPYKVYVGSPFTELMGSGAWGEPGSALMIEVGLPTGGHFIHGPDHTIQGRGTINVADGTFVNHGALRGISVAGALEIAIQPGATMVQQGTLQAVGDLIVSTSDQQFVNQGLIAADGYFSLRRSTAGPIDLLNARGAEIHLGGSAVFNIDPNNGIDGPVLLWNQRGGLISGNGIFDLAQVASQYSALLRNSGTIRPSVEGSFSFGTIRTDSSFLQDSTGTLDFDIAGSPSTGRYDRLIVQEGDVALAGTLNISLADDYSPAVGDDFELLVTEAGTITGTFDSFHAPSLSGRWWSLSYFPDKVVLSAEPITTDFDGSGVVDYLDLRDWQSAYGMSIEGDADGDGDTDGHDYLLWQRQFGSGVPGRVTAAVPEPGIFLLLVSPCVVGWLPCRRRRC